MIGSKKNFIFKLLKNLIPKKSLLKMLYFYNFKIKIYCYQYNNQYFLFFNILILKKKLLYNNLLKKLKIFEIL